MVCRFFADDISAAGALLDCNLLLCSGSAHGVHAGADDRHSAAGGRSVSICASVRE